MRLPRPWVSTARLGAFSDKEKKLEPAELVLVFMLVGYFIAGQLVEREKEIAPSHVCEAARHAASYFNTKHEGDREVRVMCMEHPDNKSA